MLYALGFPRWKRAILRQCFPGARLLFVSTLAGVPAGATVLIWGRRGPPAAELDAYSILRLEDGFLRSVGLGADLARPLSWVVDGRGIYYDARQPSDLEVILSETAFSAGMLQRARTLRERVVAAGFTKYNIGVRSWQRPTGSRKVILVPGQVESDASIACGAPGIRTNLELLRAVRQENPQAYVVYKPHPDVLARLRKRGQGEQGASRWCNDLVTDVNMGQLLTAVDEVHVLTSLAGFEALLRGKRVICYGQPFYSGWGLTADKIPPERRQRRLTLDELVAGTLIRYPLYLSRDGKRLISPEEALDELAAWRCAEGSRVPWWRGIYRVYLRLIFGVR